MINLKMIGVSLALMVSLAGCEKILPQPTIDASTDESLRESTLSVRESLPVDERAKFDEAIQTLAFSQIDLVDIFAEGAAGVGNLESRMKQSLEGKTAQEVISEAKPARSRSSKLQLGTVLPLQFREHIFKESLQVRIAVFLG